MRLLIPLCLIALLLPIRAGAEDQILWLSIGTGLTWYNEVDPDDLEALATAGSILPSDPGSTRTIQFEDKGFEVPVLIQLGVRLTSNVNVWGMYQRLPYVIDAPQPGLDAGGTPSDPPNDTVQLHAPANVFGGGMDFRLGREGYFSSMILSLGLGAIDFEGSDEDVIGYANFSVSGSGILYEASLMFEIDFARDLKFYPFVAFRYSELTNTNSEYIAVRSPGTNAILPEYSMSYTGITVGISARFKVWPFDPADDGDSIFDD